MATNYCCHRQHNLFSPHHYDTTYVRRRRYLQSPSRHFPRRRNLITRNLCPVEPDIYRGPLGALLLFGELPALSVTSVGALVMIASFILELSIQQVLKLVPLPMVDPGLTSTISQSIKFIQSADPSSHNYLDSRS